MATTQNTMNDSDQLAINRMPTPAPTNEDDTVDSTTLEIGASTYVPLTQFTLFPKLAPELRLEIFDHALPSSAIGHRMLRVTGEFTKNSRVNSNGYIRFTLLDNIHSTLHPEVRHNLCAGDGGRIRFADEDVVYIADVIITKASFRDLVAGTPILKSSHSHLLKELTMHKLALPWWMFWGAEISWGHHCQHQSPFPSSFVATPNKFIPILSLLTNLREVGVVGWDFEVFEGNAKEDVLKLIERIGLSETDMVFWDLLLCSLRSIRTGWRKAIEEGKKRPVLRDIDFVGNWVAHEGKQTSR
ncbi:hypothetical protein N431DRAFT_449533 [Stipitochalara longipes BDJ]|nr:hypothetical protein N431DRAFT_449533 [Stipitochalara longipes BDJ]